MADNVELQEVGFSNFLWNKWLQFSHLLTFKIECSQSLIIIQRNQFLFPFLFLFSSFRFKINNYLQIEFVSDTYWLGFNWKLEKSHFVFAGFQALWHGRRWYDHQGRAQEAGREGQELHSIALFQKCYLRLVAKWLRARPRVWFTRQTR